MAGSTQIFAQLLRNDQNALLNDWMARQRQSLANRADLISEADARRDAQAFLDALTRAIESGDPERPTGPAWDHVHEILGDLSTSRARQGFSPTETATFVFSLKQPLFDMLRREIADADELARETWHATAFSISSGSSRPKPIRRAARR